MNTYLDDAQDLSHFLDAVKRKYGVADMQVSLRHGQTKCARMQIEVSVLDEYNRWIRYDDGKTHLKDGEKWAITLH